MKTLKVSKKFAEFLKSKDPKLLRASIEDGSIQVAQRTKNKKMTTVTISKTDWDFVKAKGFSISKILEDELYFIVNGLSNGQVIGERKEIKSVYIDEAIFDEARKKDLNFSAILRNAIENKRVSK